MAAMGGLPPELKTFVSTPRKLSCYDGQGKKKNERWFFLTDLDRQPAQVAWRVKATGKKGKSMPLLDVHDGTRMPTARQVFHHMDADGSGSLNQQEVDEVYRITMGEKLGKKRLQEAMRIMDTDGSGLVSCDEFENWWKQIGRDLDQARDRAFALELGNPGEPPLTKRLVAPDIRSKNMWLEACCALVGKGSIGSEPAEAEVEEAHSLELSLPYDLQPVMPMPEPEPEPEPERGHPPAAPSRTPQEKMQSKWAQKWSVQHQRWYWTHDGTGQASWLKEAEMTREETDLYNHQRLRQTSSHIHGQTELYNQQLHSQSSSRNHGHMQVECPPEPRVVDQGLSQRELEVTVQAQRRLDALYFAHTGCSRQTFQERDSHTTSSRVFTHPATAFTKVLADSSGAFSPTLMSWGSARMSRATPVGRHDRPRFIGWATWAQDAFADSDAEQGAKMDRAARMQHPGTRAATYEEYTRGRIVGLPETYAPQCHDPRAPQYFPERSMLYGWLVLKGPGNEADSFAQCKDGHMLKYTPYGAALDGQQGSSGTFSGPRVTMCVACCVRVIDPYRLCRLCKSVEDVAAKESELLSGHIGDEGATETGQTSHLKTPAQLAFAKYDTNKRGVLSWREVSRMLQENGVPGDFSAVFKRFDEDRSGEISWQEFQMMWSQHGLASYVQVPVNDEAVNQAPLSLKKLSPGPPIDISDGPPPPPPADVPPGPLDDREPSWPTSTQENGFTSNDPVEEIFMRFNRNNDDIMDLTEVREMLEHSSIYNLDCTMFCLAKVCSFEVTDEYIDGLGSLFATFDKDNSGGIELAEFRTMFDRLGLEQYTDLLLHETTAQRGRKAAPSGTSIIYRDGVSLD